MSDSWLGTAPVVSPTHGETVEPHSADRLIVDANGHRRGKVMIANPQGLHLRPAGAFATTAQRFASTVTVWKDGRAVNGKSLLDLITLAAEHGTELVVEVDGADADAALPVLLEILSAHSADELDNGSEHSPA
jgi:phosphocarrier protein HPr